MIKAGAVANRTKMEEKAVKNTASSTVDLGGTALLKNRIGSFAWFRLD